MDSIKKSSGVPGFEIDPATGKYFPVPVNFRALFSGDTRTKRQNQDWSNPRKCNDTHSVQPIKFRKTESGVRKELFKLPPKNDKTKDFSTKDIKSRGPGVRKSLIKYLPTKNDVKKPIPKRTETNESLRMVPITEELEQAEEPLKSEPYAFKSPMTPHTKVSAPSTDENEVKTPDSFESNANFLKLELQCQSPMNVNSNESPVSSVCNMFENNMLLNSDKKKTNNGQPVNEKEIILELRRTMGVQEELYQKTSSKIREISELQVRQEENFRRIVNLMDILDDSKGNFSKTKTDEEKENSAIKRRSLRLQNKSPVQNKNRPPGSPGILKSGDLRKSTLTKSLVSKCQKYQIDSPRIQKAIDMYNSTRSVCNVLLTPKVSRGEFVTSPKSSNWRSNLSVKVQKQCLLLQDTPVHK